ncbi:MAG: endonuclease V [Asgard group archaeon]|nr:endonuclease V [Asgard group archaeon]
MTTLNEKFPIPSEYSKELKTIRQKQKSLAKKIIKENKVELRFLNKVTGIKTMYSQNDNYACTAGVVVDFDTFEIIETKWAFFKPEIPYIPSFLFHREKNGLLNCIEKLSHTPEVIIVNGNGIFHPSGCGMASELGIILDYPTIGITQNLMFGSYNEPLALGGYSKITSGNSEILGAALQTIEKPANPIFVSVGHMIDLKTAVFIVREFCMKQETKGKLPLPLTRAKILAAEKIGNK